DAGRKLAVPKWRLLAGDSTLTPHPLFDYCRPGTHPPERSRGTPGENWRFQNGDCWLVIPH
ncbi:hypothetical protein VS883_28550, partial [Escherichia coli]